MIKAQILVVEDQAATADLILEVLKGEGYEAQTVDTLTKARARLKKQPPELLLLDRNLPDGDGVDLWPRSATTRSSRPFPSSS
ncbi:MAG: response regulator [Elusimicrobiota bacterium]|nr:MAG: response regulator [Elusimicrobiota bacterium]